MHVVALLLLFIGSAHGLIEGLYCGAKNCYEGELLINFIKHTNSI